MITEVVRKTFLFRMLASVVGQEPLAYQPADQDAEVAVCERLEMGCRQCWVMAGLMCFAFGNSSLGRHTWPRYLAATPSFHCSTWDARVGGQCLAAKRGNVGYPPNLGCCGSWWCGGALGTRAGYALLYCWALLLKGKMPGMNEIGKATGIIGLTKIGLR